MRRREFIAGLGGAAAWPVVARGQNLSRRTARIGWLVTGSPDSYRFSLAAFREGLRALGCEEGQNLIIEYRWGEGEVDRLPALAAELVEQKVDVILAGASIGARVAKNATREVPIVAAGAGDLVLSGLVSNLARPDGNLTGFIASAPELAGKRLEIVKEIKPAARNVVVLRNTTTPQLEWKVIQQASRDLGLTLESYELRDLKELENALVAIPKTHPDFISVLNDPFVFFHRKKIVNAVAQAKLPAIYGFREFVDDGGLISYSANVADTYRRAATYIDKILKGAKVSDLPIQEPTKFELIINAKTAKALGLDISPTLIARADEVIEREGARSSRGSAARLRGRWWRTRSSQRICLLLAFLVRPRLQRGANGSPLLCSDCATSAGSRITQSTSNIAGPRDAMSATLRSRLSLSDLKSMSSSRLEAQFSRLSERHPSSRSSSRWH